MKKPIVIADYGVGNLNSILNLCRRFTDRGVISSRVEDIQEADKIILPGVGNFSHVMENLKKSGLIPVLEDRVLKNNVPILGLCVGMQILAKRSEEGGAEGLGWIDGEVVRFRVENNPQVRVPHVGFNDLARKPSPLFHYLAAESRFYFTHSYHMVCRSEADVIATTDYGYAFPAVVQKGSIYGTQFHPEKSHQAGVDLVRAFIEVC